MRGADRVKRTVEFRYKMVQEGTPGQAETVTQEDPESLQLPRSGEWFNRLGRSLLIYASEHEDRLPQSLEEIRSHADSEEQYRWFLENVEYVGAGLTVAQPPPCSSPMTRRCWPRARERSSLFLDTHIEFVEPERFAKYGLTDGIEAIKQKNAEMSERSLVGAVPQSSSDEVCGFYAHENERSTAAVAGGSQEAHRVARSSINGSWRTCEYLGAGLLFSQSPSQVVAYDRTLLAAGKGTNVLFLDNHVEFIEPEGLAEARPARNNDGRHRRRRPVPAEGPAFSLRRNAATAKRNAEATQ